MQNKTAIVTGGAKGYGAGIAKKLADAGWSVRITGRDQAALDKATEQFGVKSIQADVTSSEDWDRVFKTVLDEAGRVDVLVNNAGAGIAIRPLSEMSDAEIETSVAVNLFGALLGCKRAATVMKKQGSGTIINISSACQDYAWPGWSVYSAAKAGIAQASKCLYAELREHGVRVTTLSPSWGATEFTGVCDDLEGAPSQDPVIRAQCIKPEELGEAVLHVCNTPSHLEVLEYKLLPLVQEIMPM